MNSPAKILLFALTLIAIGCAGEQQPAPEPEAAMGPDLRGEEIAYTLNDVNFTGYMAYDANAEGPRPGVLVVHEWWGPTDYVRKRADMLAELGYTAFAIDMYGDGKIADHPEDAQKFAMEVMGNVELAAARFEQAKQHSRRAFDDG